jgi:hypothetical protein
MSDVADSMTRDELIALLRGVIEELKSSPVVPTYSAHRGVHDYATRAALNLSLGYEDGHLHHAGIVQVGKQPFPGEPA